MDPNDAIPRIFLAALLGTLIGLEREFTQKSAGLRTHILVTLGSTIFTIVSMSDFYYDLSWMPFTPTDENRIVRDPTRVAAQIVTGIGFIGGGAVLRYGATVRGLTTAASLWIMASIGMLVGIGQYRLSIISTLLAFLVLFTIGKLERHFFGKYARSFNRLKVHIVARGAKTADVQTWMDEYFKGRILEARTRTDSETGKTELNYVVATQPGKSELNTISGSLSRFEGVVSSTVKSYFESEDAS